MAFKGFPNFSSGSHLAHWSRTILAILVQGYNRNIVVKYFEIGLVV